jgi:peroxiredoxin
MIHPSSLPRRRATRCGLLLALLVSVASSPARGDDPPDFRRIAETKLRETLSAVREYAVTHPDAPDRNGALVWVLTSAMQYGLEDESIDAAKLVLEIPGLDAEGEKLARANLFMGLARKGETEPAFGHFEAFLRGLGPRQAEAALEYTHQFAAKCRVHRDFATSQQAYEAARGAFPLVARVTEIANLRLARLELIGQDPPPFAKGSLSGDVIDLAAWKGKVVLVDFWATNCPPCIAEVPNLKDLYRTHHERGLEIVGVSFDDNPEMAQTFARRADLKWPMVMNKGDSLVVGEGWRVSLIPSMFLIGRDGKIANIDLYGNDLRREIQRLLDEGQPAKE